VPKFQNKMQRPSLTHSLNVPVLWFILGLMMAQ